MNTAIVEKSKFLRAVELVIAEPVEIHRESQALLAKLEKAHPGKSAAEIRKQAAKKVISNYSYCSAFAGGATALAGVVPGVGTAVAMFGGGMADAALSMKFQVEMTMALAPVYGHDILAEEEKRLCFMIAGLWALNETAKEGGKAIGTKAFVNLVNAHLRGGTLTAVKEIFKKIGIQWASKLPCMPQVQAPVRQVNTIGTSLPGLQALPGRAGSACPQIDQRRAPTRRLWRCERWARSSWFWPASDARQIRAHHRT